MKQHTLKQHHTQILMTKEKYQDLSSLLYERTIDFINEELIEMLYDQKIVDDTGDDAIHIANHILYEFFNKQITKNW